MTDEKKAPEITPEMFTALQESVSKLEAKNKELLQEKSEAKKQAEKAAEEAAKVAEAAAKKNGDVEALEKSWSEKLANEVKSRDAKLSEYEQMINKMTIGSQAQKLAADLALPGSSDVLLPHIERRLSIEIKDGMPITRVLDMSGKPSALSIDDLRKEIESNAAFAPLLTGSKANGSGSPGEKGSVAKKTMPRSQWDNLGPIEKMEFHKSGGVPVDK